MHMLARADRHAGEADDLAIAAHDLAHGDLAGCHLVAGRNQSGDDHVLAAHERARQQLVECDHHVVFGMQSYHARRGR